VGGPFSAKTGGRGGQHPWHRRGGTRGLRHCRPRRCHRAKSPSRGERGGVAAAGLCRSTSIATNIGFLDLLARGGCVLPVLLQRFFSVTAHLELRLLPRVGIRNRAWTLRFLLVELGNARRIGQTGAQRAGVGPGFTGHWCVALVPLDFASRVILTSKLLLLRFTGLGASVSRSPAAISVLLLQTADRADREPAEMSKVFPDEVALVGAGEAAPLPPFREITISPRPKQRCLPRRRRPWPVLLPGGGSRW